MGCGWPERWAPMIWPLPAGVLFMNFGLWQRLKHYSVGDLARALFRFPGRAVELLKIPAPAAAQLRDRITTLERDIILPIKVAAIAMLLYSFYFKRAWIVNKELGAMEIEVGATQYLLWVYIAINTVVAGLLLLRRHSARLEARAEEALPGPLAGYPGGPPI